MSNPTDPTEKSVQTAYAEGHIGNSMALGATHDQAARAYGITQDIATQNQAGAEALCEMADGYGDTSA